MAEYTGINLVVEFDSVDISGQARTASVEEVAPEPETIDVTHKGDTSKQSLEGLAGAADVNITFSALDEEGDVSALMDFAINAKYAVKIYPEGKTHGKPLLTIANSRLIRRTESIPYDGAVELEAQFKATGETVTRSTYSTA